MNNNSVSSSVTDNIDVNTDSDKNVSELEEQCEQNQKFVNPIEQLQSLMNNEFVNTLVNFTNELDIAFDNIPKTTITKLRNYIKKIKDADALQKEMRLFIEKLSPFESDITNIVFCKTKLKTKCFDFMTKIVLFDDILDLNVFISENKNTKLSIVKYLNTMYMSCSITALQTNKSDLSLDELSNEINDFIKNLSKPKIVDIKNNSKTKSRGNSQNLINNLGGMGEIMESVMGNPEIMNMAMDLSKSIQRGNINPMSLVSDLMSGKKSKSIDNLINNFTDKIEKKIESGEIDKDALEQQANDLMSNLNLNDLMKSMGNMNGKQLRKRH